MKRKVYLTGEMGAKFGSTFEIEGDKLEDIFKCLDVNKPGFREYLLNCAEQKLGISLLVEETKIDDPLDVLLPLQKGDVTMGIVPAGAGGDSGVLETLVAIVMFIYAPQLGAEALLSDKIGVFIYKTIATNIAMKGLQKMMAPDPAEDEDEPTNYLFQGNNKNIIEGDPVPVLYGELMIPGQNIGVYTYEGHTMSNPVHKLDNQNNITVSTEGG